MNEKTKSALTILAPILMALVVIAVLKRLPKTALGKNMQRLVFGNDPDAEETLERVRELSEKATLKR